ncbi:EAL domain-containing protein [Pseudoalteromonas tunicata]|uniref:EAL domain protein n=1 Tax=Pseudoalteromonas tunicata D2 TaxID=87626 RepID=A4C5A5_9GAMM|nr:EAL domain-containing protein [Pseudoalteromonas tunicata]ATC96790.1 hypothetical protein PTUN_b0396 [Pseudoalteromonas tunicata]EAR30737.1 EAL domain protein [Pseudoalteromonas tunicata D2]MDP4984307.1 EAL domain-containing protein [Pseudoalteromonas tunicata]
MKAKSLDFTAIFQSWIHSRYLLSLRESFIALLPYFVSSALAILLINGAINFSLTDSDSRINQTVEQSAQLILLLFPLMVTLSVGFHYSKNLGHSGIVGAILALLSFAVHSHFLVFNQGEISLNPTGSSAYAVVIPSLTSALLHYISIFLPKNSRYLFGVSEFLKEKLLLVLPFSLVFFGLFFLIPIFDWLGIQIMLVLTPDPTSSVAELMFERMITTHMFWFFGVHGDNMFTMLFEQSFLEQDIIPGLNAKTFYDTFVLLGGTGCFVGLILAALALPKYTHERNIAKLSIPFTIFNFCEILLFALPVFLNPILLLPFIIAPCINFLLAYLFLSSGWVGFEQAEISWMTPTLINGYQVGTDLGAIILQLCLILINTLIYYPFLKWSAEKTNYHLALQRLTEQLHLSEQYAATSERRFLNQQRVSKQSTKALNSVLNEIAQGQLQLHYQPQVCLLTGKVQGFEALLRLKTAQGKLIGPYFLDTLVAHQQTELIDLWVMEQTARDLLHWRKQGFVPIVSINLNPNVLTQAELVEKLCQLFTEFPNQVKVEIVESSYLNDQALVCEHISKLKTYGIDTVIDDFGTGYSSLFMLANLPVNQVKLDRQFLVQAQTDKGKLLYQHVVNIFIQMGYTIVAEGIETEQELNWIKSLGVQVAQGWYYAKALPAKDIMEFKLNQAQ